MVRLYSTHAALARIKAKNAPEMSQPVVVARSTKLTRSLRARKKKRARTHTQTPQVPTPLVPRLTRVQILVLPARAPVLLSPPSQILTAPAPRLQRVQTRMPRVQILPIVPLNLPSLALLLQMPSACRFPQVQIPTHRQQLHLLGQTSGRILTIFLTPALEVFTRNRQNDVTVSSQTLELTSLPHRP